MLMHYEDRTACLHSLVVANAILWKLQVTSSDVLSVFVTSQQLVLIFSLAVCAELLRVILLNQHQRKPPGLPASHFSMSPRLLFLLACDRIPNNEPVYFTFHKDKQKTNLWENDWRWGLGATWLCVHHISHTVLNAFLCEGKVLGIWPSLATRLRANARRQNQLWKCHTVPKHLSKVTWPWYVLPFPGTWPRLQVLVWLPLCPSCPGPSANFHAQQNKSCHHGVVAELSGSWLPHHMQGYLTKQAFNSLTDQY